MSHRSSLVFVRSLVGFAGIIVLLLGCETTPKTTAQLELALDHYEGQRFNMAHQAAVEAARSSSASVAEREKAAYLAGLAAFRIDDLTEAELRLNTASMTTDPELLAAVQALLGQIRLDQKRPAEAARMFESASRTLTGEDARQARRYAAIAHYEAGNVTAAEQWFDPHLASSRSFEGGFTLQVGAFQDRRLAEQAAREAAELARSRGLGSASVRQSVDQRGRLLYLVQFGRFPTRQAAAQARTSLGRLDYIVAPLPRG